jgi:hypothetical protein
LAEGWWANEHSKWKDGRHCKSKGPELRNDRLQVENYNDFFGSVVIYGRK